MVRFAACTVCIVYGTVCIWTPTKSCTVLTHVIDLRCFLFLYSSSKIYLYINAMPHSCRGTTLYRNLHQRQPLGSWAGPYMVGCRRALPCLLIYRMLSPIARLRKRQTSRSSSKQENRLKFREWNCVKPRACMRKNWNCGSRPSPNMQVRTAAVSLACASTLISLLGPSTIHQSDT